MQKLFSYIKVFLLFGALFYAQSNSLFAASEIHKAIIHQYNDSTYLVLHLFNFHATAGSYEQGNLRTSGYNESEIRIINLNSQKTIISKRYSEYNFEGAFEILGCSDHNIWIYSMENKSGLQSLNLLSLKKETSQASIYSGTSNWVGRFVLPEWNKIDKYYSYNELNNSIIITNYKGNVYTINPLNLNINELEGDVFDKQNTRSLWKVVYEGNDTLDLYDEFIHLNNIKQLPDNHFNEGSFIIELNAKKQFSFYQQWLKIRTNELDQCNEKLSKIRAKKGSEVFNELNNKKAWLTQNIKDINVNLHAIENSQIPDKTLLRTSDNAFYVLQRFNKNSDSPIAIAKVNQNKHDFSVAWTLALNNMYYNVSAVQDSPQFKRFFKDETPDPSFIKISEFDNKLVIVYLMQICLLDTESGEIIWRTKL